MGRITPRWSYATRQEKWESHRRGIKIPTQKSKHKHLISSLSLVEWENGTKVGKIPTFLNSVKKSNY